MGVGCVENERKREESLAALGGFCIGAFDIVGHEQVTVDEVDGHRVQIQVDSFRATSSVLVTKLTVASKAKKNWRPNPTLQRPNCDQSMSMWLFPA